MFHEQMTTKSTPRRKHGLAKFTGKAANIDHSSRSHMSTLIRFRRHQGRSDNAKSLDTIVEEELYPLMNQRTS